MGEKHDHLFSEKKGGQKIHVPAGRRWTIGFFCRLRPELLCHPRYSDHIPSSVRHKNLNRLYFLPRLHATSSAVGNVALIDGVPTWYVNHGWGKFVTTVVIVSNVSVGTTLAVVRSDLH